MTQPVDVLDFWFAGDASVPRKIWFEKNAEFDAACGRFADTLRQARDNRLDDWAQTPRGTLALLIVLDQFPRNLHRGSPETYAADAQARAVARTALANGFDQRVGPVERVFFYLPFSHSEDLADQEQAVSLFEAMGEEDGRHARHHHDVIRRFGRFPHRNVILGRVTTAEEAAYLPTDPVWS